MELKAYKLLTYVLLLPNLLLALITFLGVIAAIMNPILLLQVILFFGVIMYAYRSFIFLNKGINAKQVLSFKFKAKLKLTIIVTVIFCILCLLSCFTMLKNPAAIDLLAANFLEQNAALKQAKGSDILFANMLKASVIYLSIYAALLLLHTLMTYKLTKEFDEEVFEKMK